MVNSIKSDGWDYKSRSRWVAGNIEPQNQQHTVAQFPKWLFSVGGRALISPAKTQIRNGRNLGLREKKLCVTKSGWPRRETESEQKVGNSVDGRSSFDPAGANEFF
jgi:hypothetical protein